MARLMLNWIYSEIPQAISLQYPAAISNDVIIVSEFSDSTLIDYDEIVIGQVITESDVLGWIADWEALPEADKKTKKEKNRDDSDRAIAATAILTMSYDEIEAVISSMQLKDIQDLLVVHTMLLKELVQDRT